MFSNGPNPTPIFSTESRFAIRLALVASVCLLSLIPCYAQQTFTVPGNSGRNWVDTGINVTPGTLITVEATGQINAGGNLGNFGPEGRVIEAPPTTFPSDINRAYGLIARITDSQTTADSEVREDWAYAPPYQHCVQYQRGRLWLTVNDDNASDNTGQFNVTITLGRCESRATTVQQSVIRVVNDDGRAQPGAEVYVNGRRVGITGADGTLARLPLRTADRIIARFLVHENSTYRENHQAGSTRNWNYRVYHTSAAVNNDGSLASFAVTNPIGSQELRLSRNNTLIGVHIVASIEWDASRAELENFRDNMLAPMSQYLYNATDGQFFVEQLELMDNAANWNSTDFRVYADLEVRPHVNLRRGGFLHNGAATWMNMRRSPTREWDYWSGFLTAAHEFGHYGFDLGDEYADGDASVSCTTNAARDGGDFGLNGPRTSCMMWVQAAATKLCSDRAENRHRRGTWQGDEDCWTHLAGQYRDSSGGPRSRWTIRTPETRAAIVGPLPEMPQDWRPRITIDNGSRRNLCGPMTITARDGSGQPLNDAGVWVHTSYGQTVYQGVTGSYPSSADTSRRDRFPGEGQIPVTGLHVGDRVAAFRIGYQRSEYVVTSADCAATSRLDRLPGSRATHASHHAPQKSELQMKMTTEPFSLAASVEPTSQAGQVQVRVHAGASLKSAPQVTVTVTGSTNSQKVTMTLDQQTESYIGQILKLPPVANASVEVTATDENNQSVSRLFNMSLSPLNPKSESEIFSANGQLSLSVPVGALPDNAYVTIGPSSAPLPDLAAGFVVVSGPFSVMASTGRQMSQDGFIRFRLPNRLGERASDGFDPSSFEIRRYNPDERKWETVGGAFLPSVDTISVKTNQLGDYAVTARRLSGPPKGAEKPERKPDQKPDQKPDEQPIQKPPVKEKPDPIVEPPPSETLRVTAVSLKADEAKLSGPCPLTVNFTGHITTNGAVTVRYTFLRSDGATGPTHTLEFEEAGTQTVTTTWTLGGEGLNEYQGWQALKILAPNAMESSRETGGFFIRCGK